MWGAAPNNEVVRVYIPNSIVGLFRDSDSLHTRAADYNSSHGSRQTPMNAKPLLPAQSIALAILVATITAIGGALRLFFVLRADFPLNDGGMFLLMTSELVQNGFRLPLFTSYNFSNIPYAYPPLPFYIAGALQQLSRLDLLLIYQYLPALVSALTIPAFFLLSREALGRDYPAIHATLVFAILPPGYEWLIMGGGVARAPAFLFSLLALWLSVRALKTGSRRALFWSALFAGLTLLSHLEMFLMTCAWIAVTALLLARNRWGATVVLAVGGGSAVLASPWWITMLARHGPGPFINAFGAGEFSLVVSLADLLLRNLSQEFLFTPILVFAILGLGRQIVKKDWLLPAWVAAAALVDARSLERSLAVPLSLLAAVAIDEIVLPGLSALTDNDFLKKRLFPNLLSALLLAYLLIRTAVTSQLYLLAHTSTLDVLSTQDRQAMDWIQQNLPVNDSFLALTAPTIWETNEVSEWFPARAARQSLTTVQGSEWLPNHAFAAQKQIYTAAQRCVLEDTTNCLTNLPIQGQYVYIYLSGQLTDRASGVHFPLPLETALRDAPGYNLVYENEGVAIFSVNIEVSGR